MYTRGKWVAAGEEQDPGFLFVWYEAAPTWDLSKPDELEAAIREANPAAGNFLPLENLLQQYRTRPEAEFRRYHLNQWTSAPEQWIGHEMWNGAAGKVRCACQGGRAATGAD